MSLESYASRVIDSSPSEVWSIIRQYDSWYTWHPEIEFGEMEQGARPTEVGAIRVQHLHNGGVARAALVALDDQAMRLVYEMLEGPYDVENYVSTIRIHRITATGGSFVEWFGSYRADFSREAELRESFGKLVYEAGLLRLAEEAARRALANRTQTD